MIQISLDADVSTGQVLVRGNITGCYQLRALQSGGLAADSGATEADSYQGLNITFTMRLANAAPDPPLLFSAVFNNEGDQMLLSFNSRTDKGAGIGAVGKLSSQTFSSQVLFNCSNIFLFHHATRTSCKWLTESLVSAGK
jgi:hypothetical protein